MNRLFYGDNLHYLREFDSASVDLIYLDPPFNSKSAYNLLFRSPEGGAVQAQTTAFKDTWRWDAPAEEAFDDVLASGSSAAPILRALRSYLGQSDMMAYLAMMTVRLVEMRRILRPTGSLYLHCDPTASHYLKVILDGIFGGTNFRNEIIWKRTASHGGSIRWGPVHDTILFYTASDKFIWTRPLQALDTSYISNKYRFVDERGTYRLVVLTGPGRRNGESGEAWRGYDPTKAGRHWAVPGKALEALEAEGIELSQGVLAQLEQLYEHGFIRFPEKKDGSAGVPEFKMYLPKGQPIQDMILDIPPLNSQAKERIGYPTQKPITLLERILEASSLPGQVVLDPFCGCGTTVEAAQRLGRQWIGIDVTHHAVDVIESRLIERCPTAAYKVQGRPEDLAAARDLARRDKYEFQWWANWLIGAQNYRERKKGSDGGIDGVIYFRNGPWGVGNVIVSVKGGEHLGVQMVRDLRGTIEREQAEVGVLITLAQPTAPMMAEAASAGFVRQSAHGRLPRLQIVTIQDLLSGRRPTLPPPIETDAFRQKLRPTRPTKVATPSPQLSLPLFFSNEKGRSDVREHLSGAVIARLGGR